MESRPRLLHPVPITDLAPAEPPAWLWRGYVARGHSTLLVGLWKAGKTTLLSWLLHDLQHGGGLVPEPIAGKVLLITEESSTLWSRRRDERGLGAELHVLCKPLRAKPNRQTWERLVAEVAELVRTNGYVLVIFDTIPAFWPVVEENDASEVIGAMNRLHAVTEADAALLLVHHPRKGDGQEGTAARGSGALTGWVDIIVELRRLKRDDPHDHRRVLTTLGRFDECPPESVVELGADGYGAVGDRAVATKADRNREIGGVLRSADRPLAAEDVLAQWPTVPKPGLRALRDDLNAGATIGRWTKTGTGVKGDAYRYGFDSGKPLSLGAGIESARSGTTVGACPACGGKRFWRPRDEPDTPAAWTCGQCHPPEHPDPMWRTESP